MVVLWLLGEKAFRVCQFMCSSVLSFSPWPFYTEIHGNMAFAAPLYQKSSRLSGYFLSFHPDSSSFLTMHSSLDICVSRSLVFSILLLIISCCCGYLLNIGILNKGVSTWLFSLSPWKVSFMSKLHLPSMCQWFPLFLAHSSLELQTKSSPACCGRPRVGIQ